MNHRLMVVSPPCHLPINRAAFGYMARSLGIPIHLVVPERHYVGGKWRETPQVSGELPYELTLLPLKGTHGRLQTFDRLLPLVETWKPTHIFLDNDPGTKMAWQVGSAARRVAAKAWCMTAENLPPRYVREFLEGLIKFKPARMAGPVVTSFLRAMAFPRIDRVFTLSNAGTEVMEDLGFANKVTKIPLGFDPELFTIQNPEVILSTRKQLGLTKPTVAYFGRLTPEKGVHLLLEAMKQLLDRPWQLLLDKFTEYQTDYTGELQRLIDNLGFKDRVVFFESSHEKMPDFMNAADFVVLPSISTPKWKEQYGRVVPEAMACGKLVIGSDSGAIPELIKGYGMIFKEGDTADLIAKLREALSLDQATLQVMGRKASQYSRSQLSIVKQVELMANHL